MIHFGVRSVCLCLLCFFTLVKLEPGSDPMRYDKYRTLDEVDEFIKNITSTYDDASEIILGPSNENRLIRGVKLSKKTDNSSRSTGGGGKAGILVDGGIHAREWVSTVALLYALGQLAGNSSHSDLIENLDWYILPLLNPDGYAFSADPKGDRLWRKNRKVNEFTNCRGVDLNRNFDFAWGGPGSSDNPCDGNYRGPKAFSEPEAKALADFIKSNLHIKMYLTLHSAAQAIIYPWGFTDERPEDWEDLDKLAKKAANEMFSINNTKYEVGPTTDVVGIGAGGSDDWAKGEAGIKYVYTMELPGPGYPDGGFNPPQSELQVISEETFQGIRVFARHLISTLSSATEAKKSEPTGETPSTEKAALEGEEVEYADAGGYEPPQWYIPSGLTYT